MSDNASAPAAAPKREEWSGQVGFILSAIGSAVGLGNIWRFPGVAYEHGGGAFMVPYIIALLTAGIPMLFLDYAIGHRFRGAAPTAFRRIGGRALEHLGWFQVAICCAIAVYYTAIIGWAVSYFVFSFDLRWGADSAGFLTDEYLQVGEVGVSMEFVPGVLIPLVLVWAATILTLASGLTKGLERANVIFLPLLVVAFIALVIRALFLDGAAQGLEALFTPNWAALADTDVWIAAYSQIFFSLSVAFGIMVTYSSYRRRRANLTTPGLVVAFGNSSFEVLAGIGVFATLGFFAYQQGIPVSELEGITGVGLSFITFPAIVSQMPGGPIFGMLFFGSLSLAGFTSLLSILQVISAGFQEKFGLTPRQAAIRIGLVLAVISVLLFSTTTGLHALDTIDNWANNIGIVFSAILTCVFVLWVLRRGPELRFHLSSVSTFKVGILWLVLVTVFAPALLGYMLYSRVVTLLTEGYAEYDRWYTDVFGWGTILVLAVLTVVLTALPWKRPVDGFRAWPELPARLTLGRGQSITHQTASSPTGSTDEKGAGR